MAFDQLEQSRPPQVEVLFGAARRPLVTLEVLRVETRIAANQIPNATVVFQQRGGEGGDLNDFSADAKRCPPGTAVTIRFGNGEVLFSGKVAEQTCRQSQGLSELTLRLTHPLQGAVSSHASRVFSQMSEEAVLRQLLNGYGIKLGRSTGLLKQLHLQLVQYECSDWQFIKTRLYANGVWLWPDRNGDISLAPPALSSVSHTFKQGASASGDKAGHLPLIESVDWRFGNRELTDGVEVSSWNLASQKNESRKAVAAALGRGGLDPSQLMLLGPDVQLFGASLDLQTEEKKSWADSRLLAMQTASVQASLTLIGSAVYQVGETVMLTGFGRAFDGQGVISSVEQKLNPGRWRTIITIGQDLSSDADTPLVATTPGLQVGVVASYRQDPDRLNRLRVNVPVLKNELWARFAAPYASDNSGVCFYPEPGDEVVLGFFGADPRYPVILGAMHNPKKPAPIDPAQGKEKKGLILKQGSKLQQLLFDVKQESVLLQSVQDKLQLKKGASFDSQQNVSMAAKEIKLEASTNVEVAGKQVKIKGNKVDLGM